jgi:4-deoxy-L-threo-5-hexosulose-uronate ketol-isomerase
MEIRFEHSPKEVKGMNTTELRASFLTDNLMKDDQLILVYTHYDRVIMVVPNLYTNRYYWLTMVS